MSDRPTKERILDAAEAIMLERSFHSVGLNQILAAVKVPKGSFYHYFESKEQFGVEMIRHYANNATAWKRQMLLETDTGAPLQRLITFFNFVIGKVQENGGKCPCLIQKIAAEVADFSDDMRAEVARSLTDSIAVIKELLDEAIAAGSLPNDCDTAVEATLILDIWSGAQQRATIHRSVEPLHQAVDQIRQRLNIAG